MDSLPPELLSYTIDYLDDGDLHNLSLVNKYIRQITIIESHRRVKKILGHDIIDTIWIMNSDFDFNNYKHKDGIIYKLIKNINIVYNTIHDNHRYIVSLDNITLYDIFTNGKQYTIEYMTSIALNVRSNNILIHILSTKTIRDVEINIIFKNAVTNGMYSSVKHILTNFYDRITGENMYIALEANIIWCDTDTKLLDLILSYDCDHKISHNYMLCKAVKYNCINIIKVLMYHSPHLSFNNYELLIFSLSSKTETIEFLVNNGMNINYDNGKALIEACNISMDVIKTLVRLGANIRYIFINPSYINAITSGHLDILHFLMVHDKRQLTKDSYTKFLYKALSCERYHIIEYLIVNECCYVSDIEEPLIYINLYLSNSGRYIDYRATILEFLIKNGLDPLPYQKQLIKCSFVFKNKSLFDTIMSHGGDIQLINDIDIMHYHIYREVNDDYRQILFYILENKNVNDVLRSFYKEYCVVNTYDTEILDILKKKI